MEVDNQAYEDFNPSPSKSYPEENPTPHLGDNSTSPENIRELEVISFCLLELE